MRKTLLPVFCLFFSSLAFAQTTHVIHFDNVSDVRQYDLHYIGSDRLHAGTAVNNQDQLIVWFAKISQNHELLWMKSIPITVNNGLDFMYMNYSVDIESCNQSDNIMLSIKRVNYSTFETFIDVLKLTATGELVWGRSVAFETSENEFQVIRSNEMLVLDNDAVVVSNGNKNGIYLCKLNAQGANQAAKRISVSEEIIEDDGNRGYTLTIAENGGYYASFQKDEHAVLAKLDGQFNTLFVKEWTSLEGYKITAINDLNGDLIFGGTTQGTDFFGYMSTDLASTSFIEFTDIGTADVFSFDRASSLPGKYFVESSHNYRLIDFANAGFTSHSVSNGFMDVYARYQLRGEDLPYRKATYYAPVSGSSVASYIEEFDLTDPQCVQHNSQFFPFHPIEIPANSVLQPALYKEDFGAVTGYSPDITPLSGNMSESCFLETAENNAFTFEIYPNPAQSGTVLSFPENTLEAEHIIFTDLQGKVMAELPFSQEIQLPESLTAGMYFITLLTKNADHQSTKKLLIQ